LATSTNDALSSPEPRHGRLVGVRALGARLEPQWGALKARAKPLLDVNIDTVTFHSEAADHIRDEVFRVDLSGLSERTYGPVRAGEPMKMA
jgi:hypothetical protein